MPERSLLHWHSVDSLYNFSWRALIAHCPQELASTVTGKATEGGVNWHNCSWLATLESTHICQYLWNNPLWHSAKRCQYDVDGRVFYKIQQTKLMEEYYDGAPPVDIHNHIRQDGLSLETVWWTVRWHHRFFTSTLNFGIIKTNKPFQAFNYFQTSGMNTEHSAFANNLELQLIKNPWQSSLLCPQNTPVHEVATANLQHREPCSCCSELQIW